MNKKEKGFFEKMKDDFNTGVLRIVDSLNEGLKLAKDKLSLLIKFTFISFIVVLFFSMMPIEFMQYVTVFILFIFSLLFLLFHHELFNRPIKNNMRFVKNVFFVFILLSLMSFLFIFNPDPDPEVSASNPIKIVTSSLAFLLLIMLLFQSIYLVKAGAGPKIALKSTLSFLGRFGMSAMFYVLILVSLFILSSIPALFGPIFIIFSTFFFFLSIYLMFILLYVFWKNAKG
jgi:hypothetical protein